MLLQTKHSIHRLALPRAELASHQGELRALLNVSSQLKIAGKKRNTCENISISESDDEAGGVDGWMGGWVRRWSGGGGVCMCVLAQAPNL